MYKQKQGQPSDIDFIPLIQQNIIFIMYENTLYILPKYHNFLNF